MKWFCVAALLAAVLTPVHADQDHDGPDDRYLKRQNARDWTLTMRLQLTPADCETVMDTGIPCELKATERWTFKTAAVVLPLPPETASHKPEDDDISGELRFENAILDDSPTVIDGYQGGGRFARWDLVAPDGSEAIGNSLRVEFKVPMRAWRTEFNEQAARQVGWPSDGWPAEAQSTFEMIPFVDAEPDGREYNKDPLRELLNEWTNGRDPKSIPPVDFAKWIAGQVVEHVQPSGSGLNFNRLGALEGIAVQPPPYTIETGRGSPFDMASLLCALYREAGLPARLVVGYDAGRQRGRDNFLTRRTGPPPIRVWVEFALYDEDAGTLTWIPVDVVAMRARSSRLPRNFMERPQRYFGTHPDLDGILPFALHYFPPTTVRAYGSPGFWGWLVTPQAPDLVNQSLDFSGSSTPIRGGDRRQR